MSDLVLNKIGYDVAGCNRAIEFIIKAKVDELSDRVIQLFREQIDMNGNGSSVMRADAKRAVREISRKMEEGILTLEIGVDEDFARSVSSQFYIRTMVAIHGNLMLGGGRIYTKPGQDTWKKHVNYHSINRYSKNVYRLKQFEQKSKSKKILNGVLSNVFKGSNKYIAGWLRNLDETFSGDFFGQFITGG